MSRKKALVILAEGAEEMETVVVVDILRRAEIDVTLASLDSDRIVCNCAYKVKVVADCTLPKVAHEVFDAVVLPGGREGRDNLEKSDLVKAILKKHEAEGMHNM